MPLWRTTQPFFLLAGCQIFSVGASAKCKLASFCRLCGSCSVFSLSGFFLVLLWKPVRGSSSSEVWESDVGVGILKSWHVMWTAEDRKALQWAAGVRLTSEVCDVDAQRPKTTQNKCRPFAFFCKCWNLIILYGAALISLCSTFIVLMVGSGLGRRNTWFCFR